MDKTKRALFVTGATGRLGRRFVRQAVEKGYRVTALVRNVEKAQALFLGLPVDYVRGNLADVSDDVLREGILGKDVIHLAASVNFYVSAEKLWDDNVEATRKIVRASQEERVGRFVHLSSTSLYHHPSYLPIDENQLPTPMGGYGLTKLEAEKIVMASPLDYIMLRPPAIYGPGFDEGFSQAIEWLRKGKLPVLGSGKNRVPLIQVDDVVSAVFLALENRKIHRDAFIITSGEELTQEKAFGIVAEALGVSPPKRKVPIPFAYGMVAIDALKGLFTGKRSLRRLYVEFLAEDRVFDISKAKKELGFSPRVTLKRGIKELLSA